MTQYERGLDMTVAIVRGLGESVVGKVHDHLILPREEKDLLEHFRVQVGGVAQYRGWMVTGREQPRTIVTATQDQVTIRYELHGYRSVNADQSSEREFAALAETITDALAAKIKAGETQDMTDPGYVAVALPPQIRKRTHGSVAGVWMHYALIEYTLRFHVRVTRT